MPAPIVLFVYNRADHTRQTVEALARNPLARESELWIFADGPKTPAIAERVSAVRHYINTLVYANLFAAVHIVAAKQNMGLAQSIITGVSQVIEKRGHAIVLEDDLVTAPDFLAFINACLDFYLDNPHIGSITGYSPLRRLPDGYHESVYLLPRSCSYGWATWRDRWERVDWQVCDFPQFRRDLLARRLFDQCGSDCYDMLRRQLEIGADSWSIRFGYWQFRAGMYTVYPAVSRVRNVGWDGSGVHSTQITTATTKYNDAISDTPMPFILSTPMLDARVIRQAKLLYSGNYLSQMARWLRCNGFGFVESAARKVLKRRKGY